MWDLNPRGLSTTDLAGLPPTRLGQSRQILASTPQVLRVFKAVSACSLILCYLVYLSFLKKDNVLIAAMLKTLAPILVNPTSPKSQRVN
jgi:hypothetical protein